MSQKGVMSMKMKRFEANSGWIDVLGGLVDLFAPYRRPRSYLEVLQEQNAQRDRESRERLEAWADELTQQK
jgi:hypothetical protein